MYPISDLTAFCRRTTGDVPPKLVGASTTVVGAKVYLYGGRLVAERKMVSDIYMFDLETFKWEKVLQDQEHIPQARYFHSADTWNNHLIIFGGMAIQPLSDNPEDLCVLNDVRLFDLATRKWLPASDISPAALTPKARYAHLSSVTSNRLFVVGGQDLNNVWLDDIHVYDLLTRTWVERKDYPRHCGTYRSVAVAATTRVRLPQEEGRRPSGLGQPGTRFSVDKNAPPVRDATQSESLIHLPYSTDPTDEHPCDIFLFSNYNFTDVQRELEVFSPLPGSDFTVSDRSASMTGAFFPPGLRFPTGAILGTHFIVAGTYLSQTFQSFSIWALDLVSMTWTRIDPGSVLSSASGSWFRSCLWPEANRFLVFGNRHGNLVEDYNRRLLSWDHVICIDLEAFGVYQPPPLLLDLPQQELGLAALEEGILADFEIVCDDGRKIKCSRKLLEDRWPWFKKQRQLFLEAAARAIETIPGVAASSEPLPESSTTSDSDEPKLDPRLTPRSLILSEPYPVTLAFLQYMYSMALITPLQHAPAVLSQLLLLSSTYDLPHLQVLVKHAMHRALSFATSVGIYGVSTLCNCRSLQIRALRVVMAYSQRRPANGRSRGDREGSSGGSRSNDSSGPGGGASFDRPSAARPRGLSDASYMHGPADPPIAGRSYANGTVDLRSVVSETDLARLLSQLPPGPFYIGHRIGQRHQSTDSSSSVETTTASDMASPTNALPPASPSPSPSPQPSTSQSALPRLRTSASSSDIRRAPAVTSVRHTSLPQGQTEQIQQARAPPPVQHTQEPLYVLHHRGSIVSMATEQDILDLADLLSPTVEVEDADILYDQVSSSHHHTPTSASLQHRISVDSNATSLSAVSTVSSPSIDSDDYCDSAYLSPSSGSFPGFHLPRPSRARYLSDTPSLSTSDSVSTMSLSSPPLSRASSFQHNFATPPTSPATPSQMSMTFEPNIVGLDIIHERRRSEEMDRPLDMGKTGSKETMTTAIAPSPSVSSFSEDDYSSWRNNGQQELSKLRINTRSPETIVPNPYTASVTSSSGSSANQQQQRRNTFARLFHKGAKSTDALSDPDASGFDAKMQKTEEKKLKKQLAKERTERLTQQFKEHATVQKASDTGSLKSSGGSSGSKKAAPRWEEEGGIWGGGIMM